MSDTETTPNARKARKGGDRAPHSSTPWLPVMMRVPTFEIVMGATLAVVVGLGVLVLRTDQPEPAFVVLAAEPTTVATTSTTPTTTTEVPASPPSAWRLTTGFRGLSSRIALVNGLTT